MKARRTWTPEEDQILIDRLKNCTGKYQITQKSYVVARGV